MKSAPRAVAYAALDEIYLLRAGCAYEAGGLRATLNTKVPSGAATILSDLIDRVLAPSARGSVFDVELIARRSEFDLDPTAWETSRGLKPRTASADDSDDRVDRALYEEALAEIARLRVALLMTARTLDRALAFKTISKNRRTVAEGQQARMKKAAAGDLTAYYVKSSTVLKHALREVGAPEFLAMDTFVAEVEARQKANA